MKSTDSPSYPPSLYLHNLLICICRPMRKVHYAMSWLSIQLSFVPIYSPTKPPPPVTLTSLSLLFGDPLPALPKSSFITCLTIFFFCLWFSAVFFPY